MKKKVSESATTLTELMIPSYANFGGKVHGGIILSLMDKVAYVCATKHADAYCVTASVSEVSFKAPVNVGDLVSLYASVNYVGKTSLIVGIKVVAENIRTKKVKHTNSSYFTFVAIDDDGNPVEVPELIIENKTELRRFAECKLRKEHKKMDDQSFAELKKKIDYDKARENLKNDRCQIGF